MYKVIDRIPSRFDTSRHGDPVACLEDEYGGQSVIYIDDGCYVLANGSKDRDFRSVKHWYPEAAKALAAFISAHPDFNPHCFSEIPA